jgi:hypothetical protein
MKDGTRGIATATRVSYELAHGAIPAGRFVLHRCDNPPCVRPDHLFLGDAAANIRDCIEKGRIYRGPRTGPPLRFTAADVAAIRREFTARAPLLPGKKRRPKGATAALADLASRYGAHRETVACVVYRRGTYRAR